MNLQTANKKKNLVLKIRKLKEEITKVLKDIEPTFDQNLMVTINQHKEDNEKLNDKRRNQNSK